jgi:hypothetical protein
METTNSRVRARIVRTDDGETYTEYLLAGVAYGSLSAVQSRLEGR